MLPLEAVKVSSELIGPLIRRIVPRGVLDFFRCLGVSLNQWSKAIQAKLPEPVVICIKLLLAWILLPLIAVLFFLAPGLAKIIVGIIVAGAAAKRMERPKR